MGDFERNRFCWGEQDPQGDELRINLCRPVSEMFIV